MSVKILVTFAAIRGQLTRSTALVDSLKEEWSSLRFWFIPSKDFFRVCLVVKSGMKEFSEAAPKRFDFEV